MILKNTVLAIFLLVFLSLNSCSTKEDVVEIIDVPDIETEEEVVVPVNFADINFSNWKVTLPVDEDNSGSPDEYKPNVLVNGGYRNIDAVKPYMYDDTSDASIVFYTFPKTSTANSSYSRTELRELIKPTDSKVNWTLDTGGTLKGKLKILEISKDNSSSREYHRVIVMQIHGVISIADMSKYGFSSNNGPPLIKMTWIDGDLWVYKKSLKNESTSGDDLLDVSSDTWTDEKHNMGTVGFNEFEFRITATKGKIELQLNNETPYIYEDLSLDKWPFENYYKAGNYLTTTNAGAFSKLKYYSLSVSH
ncbi:polysaccharide lyase family 7 protein [Polaribacter sp. PL03]|uniref:polysaccharide lyase family 7 protein n=1 Tax=Polaribacter sp. PL03 TaxID=3088353 RepID=UPI0029D21467|nr:polysaccharide lyase family 7 protein [Polaribacter sp. PL03]MDX6745378.1 polysaccharide lyase family 7 protein [Polaribacter sp. PL03]